MRFVLALLVLGVLAVGWPHFRGSDSNLGVFETRIAGISNEFMRRSDALRKSFDEFARCMNERTCEPKPILDERDRIIAKEWPGIFDRLLILDDWGSLPDSAYARDLFFSKIKALGADGMNKLRNYCLPKIEFRYPVRGRNKVAIYSFEGFDCNHLGAREGGLARLSYFSPFKYFFFFNLSGKYDSLS